MKDVQPIRRIPCTGSAFLTPEQQLTYPVAVGVLFDGQEVRVSCTLAVNERCTVAKLGTHPCTTGDAFRAANAQYFSL